MSRPLTKFRKLKLHDIRAALMFVLLLPVGVLMRMRRPDMWLVSERPSEAKDDAYWFFRCVHENSLHPATYYAIQKDKADADRIRSASENRLIAHGSLRHYLYYIASAIHINAHVGGGMPNARVCRHLERRRLVRNQKVFLGHGVTKDTIDWAFRQNARIDLFCCAAEREKQHVTATFGYTEGQVALTGPRRYDQLFAVGADSQEQFILVMPTWRTYLSGVTEEEFRESSYFRTYWPLLSNLELHAILQQSHCKLVFHLPPGMQRFTHMFGAIPGLIELSDGGNDIQMLLKGASLLVTDYSSVFFDFAYMSKPMAYYQFDYTESRAGHWAAGYFDYEADGFGPVVQTEGELVKAVEQLIQGGFVLDAKYAARAREFFAFKDAKNCARTYAAIASLATPTKQSR